MLRLMGAALALLFAFMTCAWSQNYPSRPITLVVAYAAGGAGDLIGRLLAERLSAQLGQQVIVENKPGAGGTLGAVYVARTEPDGYTLLLGDTATLVGPIVFPKLQYDPVKNFAPVANLLTVPMAFVANPSLPADNIGEMIRLVKANPGKYLYAAPGVGSTQHLTAVMLQQRADFKMDVVQYRGGAPLVTDVIGGRVPIGVLSIATAVEQAKGGKMKLLGVTSTQRSASAPETSTVSEFLPGFEAVSSAFILVPAGTPVSTIERLSNAIREAMNDRAITTAFAGQGMTPAFQPAEQISAKLPAEYEKWAGTARAAAIVAE